eukprot:GHVU01183241.1.p1 GENE.GHVU01183241.1~~GHVU01183241.1.p1  ORF type:complete len:166 (+),score=34.68 GHVU01183241.1:115-612(+)
MGDADDVTFETTDSGAAHTVPQQAGAIKKGGHVMLKDKPCKVVEYSTSKTGKHGHAKAHIVGIDIFTGKKYEDICPTSHNMNVPLVKRVEFQLVDVGDDGFVTLLLDSGDTKQDLKIPNDGEGEDVGATIRKLFEEGKGILATVLMACGEEKIVAAKELSGGGGS